MRFLTKLLLAAVLLQSWQAVYSQDLYVLKIEGDADRIAKAHGGVLADVLKVGRTAVYGATENAIAVLSYRPAGSYVLDLMDMATGALSASWPVAGEPVMQLSGPSRDIVLTDTAAYFLTLEHGGDTGASFHFNQLSLADGAIRQFPLPARFSNPRLVDYGGVPLLYSWNGFGVVKFDSVAGRFEELVSRVDVGDVISREEAGRRSGQIGASAFADHVAVPGAGVFRLSKLGELHRVLNADLSPVDAADSIALGPAENILRLFATTVDERPAIAAVLKTNAETKLVYVDAMRLNVLGERPLGRKAIPQSFLGSTRNTVFYIDRAAESIKALSKRSEKSIARLPAAPDTSARILAVAGGGR